MKGYDGSGISMSAVLGRLSGDSKSLWKERREERERGRVRERYIEKH
jgi:hypothetical protein